MSKMVLKELDFLSISSTFVYFGQYDLVQISVLAFAMVARKSFIGKFTAKNDLPIEYFRLPLLTLTLEV